MPWRRRNQQDPRHAKPCRIGSEIPCCRDEGVQERATQERHDEVDARKRHRCEHEQHRALLMGCKSPREPKLPPPATRLPAQTAAAACAGCHGVGWCERKSRRLQALPDRMQRISRTRCKAYKQGARSDETMKGLAASLDDSAVKNVAAFYAGQEPKQPNVRKPLTAEEWAQRCDRCHGVNGNSTDPRLPALAAQRAGLSGKGFAGLSDRRAQEPSDGGNVRRADGSGYQPTLRPTMRARRRVGWYL